jgi:hypothetical protein
VLDQQNREAGVEPHEEFRHLGRFSRRETCRRLIQQQNLWVAGEAEHDLELALLPMREVANLGVLAIHEGGAFQQIVRLGIDVAIRGQEAPHHEFRPAQALDRQQHVVENSQPRKQARDLKSPRHPQRRAPMAGPTRHILAEQQHLARRRREYPGYQIEQRRLAGAVRADNRLAVARHDLERDVAHGAQAAEALGQPVELKDASSAVCRRVRSHADALAGCE